MIPLHLALKLEAQTFGVVLDLIHLYRCEFTDSDKEEHFRNEHFEESKFQANVGFLVMAFSMILFLRTDKVYITNLDVHDEVMYLRIFYSVITLAILYLWNNAKYYQMGDIIMLVWSLFTFIVISFINITRDAEFSYHHITDVLVIMSFYIFFSNRLIYQFIPSILYSITNIIIFSNLDVITVTEVNSVTFAHIAANFMGIFVSYKTQRSKRIYYDILLKKSESD